MTDRLGELRQGRTATYSDAGDAGRDLESGLGERETRALAHFQEECGRISAVIQWANERLGTGADLGEMERKVEAVRARLKRIAEENKRFRKEHPEHPAVVRTRIVQHTQLARAFMDLVGKLEQAKETHRATVRRELRNDVRRIAPHLGDAEAEQAIDQGRVEQVLVQRERGVTRHQLDSIRARNAQFTQLEKSVTALHQMFTDMSIIVDGQQDLLNDAEYNVEQALPRIRNAAGELEIARTHQKRRRKKVICLIVLLIILVLVIVGIILIILSRTTNLFGGGNGGNTTQRLLTSAWIDPGKERWGNSHNRM